MTTIIDLRAFTQNRKPGRHRRYDAATASGRAYLLLAKVQERVSVSEDQAAGLLEKTMSQWVGEGLKELALDVNEMDVILAQEPTIVAAMRQGPDAIAKATVEVCRAYFLKCITERGSSPQ